MIRYAISKTELVNRVDALAPGWRTRAAALQGTVNTRGRYDQDANLWSDIKPVFMAIQANKCIYCERALGGRQFGKGEHDVEHFRPKSAVRAWPPVRKKTAGAAAGPAPGYDFDTGAASDIGYYWLAYELDNYATACKSCNSGLKAAYFPILGKRQTALAPVAKLNAREHPLLLFPLGKSAPDPRRLIEFDGIVAKPKSLAASTTAYRRAKVTIDFFDLNGREELLQARFQVVREMYAQYRNLKTGATAQDRKDARTAIAELTSAASPHSACAQDYLRLLGTDPVRAHTIMELARKSVRGAGQAVGG